MASTGGKVGVGLRPFRHYWGLGLCEAVGGCVSGSELYYHVHSRPCGRVRECYPPIPLGHAVWKGEHGPMFCVVGAIQVSVKVAVVEYAPLLVFETTGLWPPESCFGKRASRP